MAQAAPASAASPTGGGGSGWDLVYMDGAPLTVAGVTAAAPAPAAQDSAPVAPAQAGGARKVTPAAAPTMAPAQAQSAAATLGDEPSSPIVSAASLVLHDVDPGRQEGVVRSVYGETLGHYADWAQVPALEIRERNGITASGMLRPGRQVVIPLHAASAESFNAQRVAYHRARELNFFSAYTVREKFEVRLTRGQSIWAVAQEHNVPMWLLYRENPALLERPAQAGMRVIVPRVEEALANPR